MTDSTTTATNIAVDVAVIGGGVAGIYAAIEARRRGFTVQGLEALDGLGGTWFTNRYPGARCDIESLEYSFGFDEDLQQSWVWTERYAAQPEILGYIDHVVDRHRVHEVFRCGTRVDSASFSNERSCWTVVTDGGDRLTARWLILATGGHSVPRQVLFDGQDQFDGALFHTAHWPDGFDLSSKRVAVIGTGPSGIQCVPEIAAVAEQVFVLQRTPNYVVPSQNTLVDPSYESFVKSSYPDFRKRCASNTVGIGAEYEPSCGPSTIHNEAQRIAEFERRWQYGGFTFVFAYDDMGTSLELAQSAADFIRSKIASAVDDTATAERLSPQHPFGARRLCVGTGYYESFNRPNVELIDLRATPVRSLNAKGIELEGPVTLVDLRDAAAHRQVGAQLDVDVVVLATGFEDQTSAVRAVHIENGDRTTLAQLWANRPSTYLGMLVADMPNLFLVNGPGSPSITTNMIANAEQNITWIFDCIAEALDRGQFRVEADRSAQRDWSEYVDQRAEGSLIFLDSSRYVGTAPNGDRYVLPFIGVEDYLQDIQFVIDSGYVGCVFGETSHPLGNEEQHQCATSFSSLR